MIRPLFVVLAFAIPACTWAGEPTPTATFVVPAYPKATGPVRTFIDLRTAGALENLKRTNPAHFAKIQKVIAGLEEQPDRVEGDWLQVTFDAHDVDLQRMMVRTSYPPKQVLNFRLDDVRYTMYVARRDMVADFSPAH